MKKVAIIIVIILSFGIIVAGKIHWNNKIEATTKIDGHSEKNKEYVEEIKIEKKKNGRKQELMKFSENLPDDIKAKIGSAIDSNKPVHLVIMGSESTSDTPGAWPTLLKDQLLETYGKDVFTITIKGIKDKTSTQVVEDGLYQDVIELKPDILLLEPFILADNGGLVPMQKRLDNLTEIISDFKSKLPELSILLQPANPLYKAVHYPVEVTELKEYAEKNHYTYLDHWSAWPDPQSDEIVTLLRTDVGMPNEKGNIVWAKYLESFFIGGNRTEDE